MTKQQLLDGQKLADKMDRVKEQLAKIQNWRIYLRSTCNIEVDTGGYICNIKIQADILIPFLQDLETKLNEQFHSLAKDFEAL